ncbi:hypothetical protein QJS10_CPA09g00977 [Acorus calamus]|uniref:DUF4283 domain-containing protein n=1 Tax=Acorus calamus TaxID=4465 RepID=A0AAV9E872_ACOCL|nr:hypothetical protein QJS10_CPA09g00977 [Acorus calamus]
MQPSNAVEFYPPHNDGGQKVAILEEEEVAEAKESWGHILVGYVWGKNPVYVPFLQFLKRLWNPKGTFILTLQENDFFMIRFSLVEDLTKVLLGGPWSMDNRPFVIQRWNRDTKLEFERLSSIPVWIKFPNLPLHFWSPKCIGRIASLIGIPLYMDSPTALKTRTSFARVCVEVEAGCEFPNEVFVEIRKGDRVGVKVAYDWQPLACQHCNTFGHDSALCNKKDRPSSSLSQPSNLTETQSDEDFVQVLSKKKPQKDVIKAPPSLCHVGALPITMVSSAQSEEVQTKQALTPATQTGDRAKSDTNPKEKFLAEETLNPHKQSLYFTSLADPSLPTQVDSSLAEGGIQDHEGAALDQDTTTRSINLEVVLSCPEDLSPKRGQPILPKLKKKKRQKGSSVKDPSMKECQDGSLGATCPQSKTSLSKGKTPQSSGECR